MTDIARVEEWLASLHEHLHLVPDLHPEAAKTALRASLQSLQPLAQHIDRPAPTHTVFVASRTVFTVALEWCAVLLARGGRVTLKSPRGLEPWYDAITSATELPLEATRDRLVIQDADRVVLMGSDDTVSAIRETMRAPERLLAFGSRSSLVWWTDPANADALARDVLMYDGRGCMSPTAIHTPLEDGPERLAEAMARQLFHLPTGTIHPAEGAWNRQRQVLAQITGRVVGRVMVVPAHLASDRPTPGRATVHVGGRPTPDPSTTSCVGTDALPFPGIRTVALGEMQTPSLDRHHDGVRWLDVV